MLHVTFYMKPTWGETLNKTSVSGKLVLLDNEFTIMTKYIKVSRVWNFKSQISKLTEYLSLNHPCLRDLNQLEEK